jgi:hypothetical protein
MLFFEMVWHPRHSLTAPLDPLDRTLNPLSHCSLWRAGAKAVCLSRTLQTVVLLAGALFVSACNRSEPPSSFVVVRADRQIAGLTAYPLAVDPSLVGSYPPDTKSGAGYFYDQVLEYRVWLHPEKGAEPLNGTEDYFVAFAQYEAASAFSKKTAGAEPPLVLVRQLEWINEPERGRFVPEKGERITEWQVRWLSNSRRTDESIREFMKNPKEADP